MGTTDEPVGVPAGSTVYRATTLRRLSSPEQLDRLMEVAGPRGWLVVAALVLVVVSALVWGFVGSIPTHVPGNGILTYSGGGVQQVVAVGAGQLTAIEVKVGDVVTRGQILARVDTPQTEQAVADARDALATLKGDRQKLVDYYGTVDVEQKRLYEEARTNTQALIDGANRQLDSNRKILAGYEKLLADHYTTIVEVESARERVFQIQAEQDQNRQKLVELEIQRLQQIDQRTRDLENYDLQIVQTEGKLADAELQLRLAREVTSPLAGRVVEVSAERGSTLAVGAPIVLVEFGEPVLEATFYAPAGLGKEVEVGMPANVAPETVRKEEFGTMIGTITYVGAYPATPEEMTRVLNDKDLVASFSSGGPPLMLRARLELDDATASGYRWSSSKGPPVKITSGTVATATVTVRTQQPITLVIPAIRRFLGLDA